jgi:hypothetical protein
MKKYSASLAIKEMQINVSLGFSFTSVSLGRMRGRG